ncbi:formylglycine-generating enzyme family protein [bacterium]|nr:formylglycine-generating enzyme family protein [bacterium]
MNKIWKITINILFITVALAFCVVFSSITHSAKNRAPVVSNVHAQQRLGTDQAVITYDVDDADGDTLTISVHISDDGGNTFTVPAKTFSGDIGAGIKPGKNKRIVWDAGKDLTDPSLRSRTSLYDMDFQAKIIADDGKQTDEIIWEKDGAKMRLIPAGAFSMGSNDGESNEKPVHTVYLDAFYMDVYEVTVGQYRKFIKATGHNTPNWSKVSKYSPTDNHPIVYVTWDDAQAYCKWAGKRLPTEAEWEKAARGGLVGKKYPWGDEAPDAEGKYRANYYVGNNGIADADQYCAPVGSFSPNGYGLYDMAGNVWEWCEDWYDEKYYSSSPRKNPPGPASGSSRVVRGGSWSGNSFSMRAADRFLGPFRMKYNLGFRSCVAQDVTP